MAAAEPLAPVAQRRRREALLARRVPFLAKDPPHPTPAPFLTAPFNRFFPGACTSVFLSILNCLCI